MTKFEALRRQFHEAVERLEDILQEPKTDIVRDSAIKRFELAFDLAWKIIKATLEEPGVSCASPLSCFKEAYHQRLIEFNEVWIDLTKTGNQTVHTYEEQLAEEVYAALPHALEAFRSPAAAIETGAQQMNA